MATYGQLTLTDTLYSGEMFSQIYTPVIFGSEIIGQGHARVIDSIKKEISIPKISSTDLIQDYAAIPTATGSTVVTSTVLTPHLYQIYAIFNPQDFSQHWTAKELQDRLIGRNLPVSIESGILLSMTETHTEYLNEALMNNVTGGTAPYDKWSGFIQRGINSASVNKVTGVSAVTFTASNIIAEIEKIYALTATNVKKQANFKFFMSHTSFELYSTAQYALTYKGVAVTELGVNKYKGITIVPCNMRDNTILGAVGSNGLDSNMVIGMNSMADSYVQIAKLQANSDVMFYKLIMAIDCNFVKDDEVSFYYGA